MKKLFYLTVFIILAFKSQSQQKAIGNSPLGMKVECSQLQIVFTLPSGFTSLDDAEMERLSQKGKKAIKEEFDNDQVLGWQNGCMNLRDSLKRLIIINHISVKEAILQDSSVNKFIEKTFDEANEFLIRRIQTRLGIEFKKDEVVRQSTIHIAGYQVRKDAVTLIRNQQIEKAIESAIKM